MLVHETKISSRETDHSATWSFDVCQDVHNAHPSSPHSYVPGKIGDKSNPSILLLSALLRLHILWIATD